MINLNSGTSSLVLLSLTEALPDGYTQSNYKFTFTEPLSGSSKVFYPLSYESGYKWSSFTISVGTPESSLTASYPTLNLAPGIWNYIVSDTISGNTLNQGMLKVIETKVPTPTISRTKDIRTYKR